jgi:hypothetical protein
MAHDHLATLLILRDLGKISEQEFVSRSVSLIANSDFS